MGKVCSVCHKFRPAAYDAATVDCPTCGNGKATEERCLVCSAVQGGTALTEGGTHVAVEDAWGHIYDDPALVMTSET